MRVNSTGLGKTTMIADVEGFQTSVSDLLAGPYAGNNGDYIVLGVEAVKAIHWIIRIAIDGQDLRGLILKALKPKVLFRVLSILLSGSKLG
jgi:hypothetical protein